MELDLQAQAIVDRANSSDAPSITSSAPKQARKTMSTVLNMYGWTGPAIV